MDESKKKIVIKIISRVLERDAETLDIEKDITEFEDWDSLAHVQILAGVVDELDVQIDITKINDFKNINEFIEMLGE